MSKPTSHHFSNTTGANVLKYNTHMLADDIIAIDDIDFRPHPTKYKQPSSKKMKEYREKYKAKKIKKDDYKRMNWYNRFSARRRRAINLFWSDEKALLKAGKKGTRNWSPEQIQAIISNKRPKYRGKSIESHHMFSASQYPHLADQPRFIVPVTHDEHFRGWHGSNYRKSLPGRPIHYIKQF